MRNLSHRHSKLSALMNNMRNFSRPRIRPFLSIGTLERVSMTDASRGTRRLMLLFCIWFPRRGRIPISRNHSGALTRSESDLSLQRLHGSRKSSFRLLAVITLSGPNLEIHSTQLSAHVRISLPSLKFNNYADVSKETHFGLSRDWQYRKVHSIMLGGFSPLAMKVIDFWLRPISILSLAYLQWRLSQLTSWTGTRYQYAVPHFFATH